MNRIPLVDLKAEYLSIKDEIDTAIQRVVNNTNFILGEEVDLFEQEFAHFCTTKHCIGVASGTAALHLALLACGVQAGDEVITTPFTFIATAEAISYCGAIPVFVDINPLSYTIDPGQIDSVVTAKTRAILPVHLYGQSADMGPIKQIADKHGLFLVEDAAQAHGAEYHGQRVGTLGDIACFSFYPGKNLGAYGDAGAIVTNRDDLAARVMILRNHGRPKGIKYEHHAVGYGERLDTLQASVLLAKLAHLEVWTEQRRARAKQYNDLLSDSEVMIPTELPDVRHVYHLYVGRHYQRDMVLERLQQNGIGAGVHYPLPLHLQPAYKELGYSKGSFPQAEAASKEVFSLPLYPALRNAQQELIISLVKASIREVINEPN